MPFATNIGSGGQVLDAVYGVTSGTNGNAPLLLEHDGTSYVYLPGAAGNFISVPDAAALDITGDIEIVARVALDDWTPAALTIVIAKTTTSLSYDLRVETTGALRLAWSSDGTTLNTPTSTASVTFANGQAAWIKATRTQSSGIVRFWTAFDSPTEPTGGAWTQLGTDVVSSAGTSIFAGTSPVEIGARNNGASAPLAGKFFRAIIRSGIGGTVVLDTDFSTMVTTGSEVAMLSPGAGSPVIPEALQTLPNLGWGGGVLDARYGSTAGADTNDPLLLTRTTENYLYLPGAANNFAAVGDSPVLDIAGDIDIRAYVALDDWTPALQVQLVSKHHEGVGGYALVIETNGRPEMRWTNSAGSNLSVQATAATGVVDGSAKWVRSTLDVDNGASGFTVSFFLSDDGVTWTPLGTVLTSAGATNIGNSATPVRIGAYGDQTPSIRNAAGKFFRAQVLSGIGGTVALDVNFPTGIVDGAQTSLSISGTAADQLDNALVLTNLGTGGPLLNAQRGSSLAAADTNDPLYLPHSGTNYLYLPGGANNEATPGTPSQLNTTDIDMAFRIAPASWAALQTIYAQANSFSAGNVRSQFTITAAGRLSLGWSVETPSALATSGTSTVSVPFAAGQAGWVRVTLDYDTGGGSYELKFWTASDSPTIPAVWTQLGTTITGTQLVGTRPIRQAWIGAFYGSAGIERLIGAMYRAVVYDSIGGTVVFDADFTTGITSGGQTTFTESSVNAATVTINRSTSGRKSVAVVQPTLLFGTDDYLDIPDSDLIDLGASDSLTVMVAARVWGNAPSGSRFLHKGGITGPRWGLAAPASGALNRAQGFISDGVAATVTADSGTYTYGTLSVLSATFNRATQQILAYVDSTPGSASSSIAGLNATGATSARVGSNVNTGYMDMELYGVAIWRRSLSASELGTIASHYSGTVTPASLALLGEAVCWVDPARSKQAAAISRSTSGRKSVAVTRDTLLFATDDYLEIPDNDLIDFGATDSYTFTVAVRQWSTSPNFAPYVSKILAASTGVGYAITNNGTGNTSLVTLADGVIAFGSSVTSSAYATGAARVLSGVVNRQDQTGKIFTGGVENASLSTAAIGSFASGNPLRFGTVGAGTGGFADMEFYGAAVFRRALSAAELATVNAHYQTGPTTASTALLSQAVLWLDPTQRRVASINRAASGRKSVAVARDVWLLGTDDFFQVVDSDLLDMGASDSFTVMAVTRAWNSQATGVHFVTKRLATGVAEGWTMRLGGGSLVPNLLLDDGPDQAAPSGSALQQGSLVMLSGTLDRNTTQTFVRNNSIAGSPVSSAAIGSLASSAQMRIGATLDPLYGDFEVLAVAVWRRALTAAEITAIVDYYGA